MPIAILVSATTTSMTFSQHLVLWLHVGFAVFTLGPLTLVISSTPRYIRRGEIHVVRYLARITFIFLIGSLGVLLAGVGLSQMLKEASKPYLIVAETLFLVTIVLLVLIVRDQRHAIRALTAEDGQVSVMQPAASPTKVAAGTGDDGASSGLEEERVLGEADPGPRVPGDPPSARQVANIERSRIAMLGGLVSLIYLVILVLMIWNN